MMPIGSMSKRPEKQLISGVLALIFLLQGCSSLSADTDPLEARERAWGTVRSLPGQLDHELVSFRHRTREDEPAEFSARERLWPDLKSIPGQVLGDLADFFTKPANYLWLGVSYGAGELVFQENGDSGGGDLDPNVSNTLDFLGTGLALSAAGAALYGYALATDDPRLYDAGRASIASLASTGLVVVAMKTAFPDDRPKGSLGSFPSGHAAASMAFAASLQESYGWWVGLPLFVLSGMIGVQRVDSANHAWDDIVVGWTLGYLIGTQVTSNQQPTIFGATPSVSMDPSGRGWALSLTWSR